ncbi:hypothetical protein [Streptomyces laurentii]|uniref:hypothetical protein n=1 Tax=Streptomyces laurentii TaxID=39478 RepID=UPI0033C6527B
MSERVTLPADVAELLSAIVEALDLPIPSIDPADEHARYRLLERRAQFVAIALRGVLQYPDYPDLESDAAWLRRHTARFPLTYTAYVPSGRKGGVV